MCYEPVDLFSTFPLLFLQLFPGLAFDTLLRLFYQKIHRTDVESAGRDVHRDDANFHGLAQAYAAPRTLAYDALGLFVVLPLVGPQSVHSD